MNQVERWFGYLTDQKIRRGVHKSVQSLEADIRAWIKNWNENPRPFAWTKTAEEIFTSPAEYMVKISGAPHQFPCRQLRGEDVRGEPGKPGKPGKPAGSGSRLACAHNPSAPAISSAMAASRPASRPISSTGRVPDSCAITSTARLISRVDTPRASAARSQALPSSSAVFALAVAGSQLRPVTLNAALARAG